jgi:PPOX class probable FMN-dependent enzyme
MQEEFLISSKEQLRTVIAEPNPVIHRKILPQLDHYARQFIMESPLVFVSTTDARFNVDVSPKGDQPGFVRIDSDSELTIPERPGNRLAYGFQNILETGSIGLIFVVPGVTETLRITGAATITRDPALMQEFIANGKPALLCTRVTIRECFFHCGKALIRSKLWQPDHWAISAAKDASLKQAATGLGIAEEVYRAKREEDYRNNL